MKTPLFVKTVDGMGSTIQSILLADADPWICARSARLQGMTVELSEYMSSSAVWTIQPADLAQ